MTKAYNAAVLAILTRPYNLIFQIRIKQRPVQNWVFWITLNKEGDELEVLVSSDTEPRHLSRTKKGAIQHVREILEAVLETKATTQCEVADPTEQTVWTKEMVKRILADLRHNLSVHTADYKPK